MGDEMVGEQRKSDTYEVCTGLWLADLQHLDDQFDKMYEQVSSIVENAIMPPLNKFLKTGNGIADMSVVKAAFEEIVDVNEQFTKLYTDTTELMRVVSGADFPIASTDKLLDLQRTKKRLHNEFESVCRDLTKALSANDRITSEEITAKLNRTYSALLEVRSKDKVIMKSLGDELNNEAKRGRRYKQ